MNDSESLFSSGDSSGDPNGINARKNPIAKTKQIRQVSKLPPKPSEVIEAVLSQDKRDQIIKEFRDWHKVAKNIADRMCDESACALQDFENNKEQLEKKDRKKAKKVEQDLIEAKKDIEKLFKEIVALDPSLNGSNLKLEDLTDKQLVDLKKLLEIKRKELEREKKAWEEAKAIYQLLKGGGKSKGVNEPTFYQENNSVVIKLVVTEEKYSQFKNINDPSRLASCFVIALKEDKELNEIELLGKFCEELSKDLIKVKKKEDLEAIVAKKEKIQKHFGYLFEKYPFAKKYELSIRLKLCEPFINDALMEQLISEFHFNEIQKKTCK